MSHFCSKCNKDYDESTMFCPDCGSKLESNDQKFIDLDESTTSSEVPMTSNVPETAPLPTTVSQNNQPQTIADSPTTDYKPPMEKFGFFSMILLSCITLGIYGIYWLNKFQKAVNSFVGKNVAATGWKLVIYLIITLGIYGIYQYYEDIVALNEAKDQRNMPGKRRSVAICVILMLFGLAIIPWYWMVSDANDIIDYENWNRGH